MLAAKLANKREKAGGDGGFTVSLRQPLSPVCLAQVVMRKRRRERLNWFPPAEAALKRTLIHNIISILLGSRPPWVSPAPYNGEDGSL